MPSPIAHSAIGYVVYGIFRQHQEKAPRNTQSHLLIAAIGLSLLPDLDSVLGLMMGDLGRYHNGEAHSLAVALALALGGGAVLAATRRSGFGRWCAITLLCYGQHVFMDYFTIGRGVLALWPFSTEPHTPPIKLFYGLHWSEGWFSVRHLWTLITELGFVAILSTIVQIWNRLRSAVQTERAKERGTCALG